QVISLGRRVAGVMGTPDLCQRVKEAGEAVGEPAWPMPLPDEIRKGLASALADVAQLNTERVRTMLQRGALQSELVAAGVAGAPLDIAGPGYHAGEPYGYVSTGGTGFPVRTLLRLVDTPS